MCRIASLTRIGLLVTAATLFASLAHGGSLVLRHIRVLETDDFFSEVNLDGVVYPPYANSVLSFDHGRSSSASLELVADGSAPGHAGNLIKPLADPINLTYDAAGGQLVLLGDRSISLYSNTATSRPGNSAVSGTINSAQFGIKDPVGIAIDPAVGTLYVLDKNGSRLVQIKPVPGRNGANAETLQQGRVSRVDLQFDGAQTLRGLAFNPISGKLYTIDSKARQLISFDITGADVDVGTFSTTEWRQPEAYVFAPSLDTTDDPLTWHLFIASDEGVSGEVAEWSFE